MHNVNNIFNSNCIRKTIKKNKKNKKNSVTLNKIDRDVLEWLYIDIDLRMIKNGLNTWTM